MPNQKFPHLSREEIEQMLGLSDLKQKRVYQEARQEGRQEGESTLILRQLARRFGPIPIPSELEAQIRALSLPQLEALGEALLDCEQSGGPAFILINHYEIIDQIRH